MAALTFGPTIETGGVRFRLWAPSAKSVDVAIEDGGTYPLDRQDNGWWERSVPCAAGTQYRFVLSDGMKVPDPASNYQPADVHGPSQVVDHAAYQWQQTQWRGRPWRETLIYELHVGMLGGYKGVAKLIPSLAELGVTAVELMPIAEFSGNRNWGYDGVLPFAAESAYGTPDELKALIDQAHGLGLMVFLDVVYNHFGPDGNWLPAYTPEFFRDDIATPWGAAIDFRRPEVRAYFIQNALYWLDTFRFDGLRLDAVHQISEQDWLTEMAETVRAALPDRQIHLILENEHNTADHLRGPLDAQWNDDFHNVMHVLLTDETTSYYSDFAEQPAQRLARALEQGFIYQGEPSPNQGGKTRGSPSGDLPPFVFVDFLQNHDQIGNRAMGDRLTVLTSRKALEAATALLLLCPHIPLMFMGDEVGSTAPFLFFTDFHDDLADAVREGRRREFASNPHFSDPEKRARIPDPNSLATFEASRPDFDAGADWRTLYTSLIALRRRYIVPQLEHAKAIKAEAIGPKAVLARWRLGDATLTIAVNLGGAAINLEPPAGDLIWGEAGKGLPGETTLVWLG